MKIHKIDHVGIIVNDLSAAKEFFIDFGLDVLGEAEVDGKWAERIIGLTNVKSTIVMLGMPDGQAALELVKFHTPSDIGIQQSFANHIAFAVEDIESIVAKLKKKGTEVFFDIQNYGNAYKLCFVHGPEGIVLELAEKIKN
ncbi:catechol 2,3-dioxygenase-like lactoylglutathione lyase family enzyme [Lysinibacillus composti]|uniref:VOC family protein n=1 Tax=Lysinibacillus composti TaxID=720633 RepID=A0A3N9UCT0_9BACI|nr:VOC family protein [Lysinibacillus composti]MBM7609168.1 catechol 2,3-dioxygenase-like lactoylglutathione lyase family enzyme [Lysinibacillus composti]RQW74219.1 VOC family protein [Lysinibacillus composti]